MHLIYMSERKKKKSPVMSLNTLLSTVCTVLLVNSATFIQARSICIINILDLTHHDERDLCEKEKPPLSLDMYSLRLCLTQRGLIFKYVFICTLQSWTGTMSNLPAQFNLTQHFGIQQEVITKNLTSLS